MVKKLITELNSLVDELGEKASENVLNSILNKIGDISINELVEEIQLEMNNREKALYLKD